MDDKPISSSYAQQLLQEQEQHEAERKALREEFEQQLKDEWSPEVIKDKLSELLPDAYTTLKDLIANAESESVRANLVKYVFDVSLKQLAPGSEDPNKKLEELLADLRKA